MGSKSGKEVPRDVIVIGASAGGVEAILGLLQNIPKTIDASIFVVLHVSPTSPSVLPQLISARTALPAIHPENETKFERGKVYVAPPDHHMTLANNHIVVERGPRENRHRPAVDPLFRSAALAYGPRVIGVILSGTLDDGTAGLHTIKTCGGTAVVQHPEDAICPGMPENALRYVEVDHCVPLEKMSKLLVELVGKPASPSLADCEIAAVGKEIEGKLMTPKEMARDFGPPSGFICPECNGPLWEMNEGRHTHFRCLVGHKFSPESFLAEEGEALERALWVAVKTLEERITLLHRLADRTLELGQSITAESFREKAEECRQHANTLRRVVQKLKS